MKKLFKPLAILMLAVMTVSAFAGCSSKTPITEADFIRISGEKGLAVEDMSDVYIDEIFTGSQMATSDDGWEVVFFTIDSFDDAKGYYETVKDYMVSQKTGAGTAQTTDRSTWGSYAQTNGGRYMYVGWIDTTMVYADVDEAHKTAVQEFVKTLGY